MTDGTTKIKNIPASKPIEGIEELNNYVKKGFELGSYQEREPEAQKTQKQNSQTNPIIITAPVSDATNTTTSNK